MASVPANEELHVVVRATLLELNAAIELVLDRSLLWVEVHQLCPTTSEVNPNLAQGVQVLA
eukprot:CAMPEP_0179020804 /NCGR_PEP_ID=MMETSP0796-20121207/5564_1 /TAXON_ID=73915 /ORGANISM="Pyrodinium bahamense, Strain pbaha01" /LENGTH=60 /DNA_ID=CAMNT_0020716617 /DNA_START=189 /DNA_END=367 /DNA_ORIENTATION=+